MQEVRAGVVVPQLRRAEASLALTKFFSTPQRLAALQRQNSFLASLRQLPLRPLRLPAGCPKNLSIALREASLHHANTNGYTTDRRPAGRSVRLPFPLLPCHHPESVAGSIVEKDRQSGWIGGADGGISSRQ